uniref:Tf2-1-like SH3-like domain-containing protein n=1 Tax=Hyaloperonospora arabidopsidis (strain Emoy2) TaxID=559515 RepID=M4C4R2_HYAAE
MAAAQDLQKENSDRHWRRNTQVFKIGDLVLLNARNLPIHAVLAVGSTKLRLRFVDPFMVICVHGNAYTLNFPSAMATHPTFYVGMIKVYLDPSAGVETDATCGSSSGEIRQSMAPLERLSEPEEQFALEYKQDTPRDTQIVPKRVQEPGLSSPSVAQGSSPGPPGSSSIDIDHPALSASSQPTTRLARSVVPGDAVGGLGTPHAVAGDDHPNGHGYREPGRGPSAQTARVGTLPNDPGNGSRKSEETVTPHTDEKNRGGMIRPPSPCWVAMGNGTSLWKGLWGTAGWLVARSSG